MVYNLILLNYKHVVVANPPMTKVPRVVWMFLTWNFLLLQPLCVSYIPLYCGSASQWGWKQTVIIYFEVVLEMLESTCTWLQPREKKFQRKIYCPSEVTRHFRGTFFEDKTLPRALILLVPF